MAKFTVFASTLLVAFASVTFAQNGEDHSDMDQSMNMTMSNSTAAAPTEECASNVSTSFIATIDNSTYFNTCAEGTTFNISSVFDVLNFTDSDFLTFCNSSTCLAPVHELMDSVDCLITYQGTPRDLADEVSKLHDQCHEVLEDAGEEMNMSGPGNSTTPAPSADNTSSASSIMLTMGLVISSAILAVSIA
ncbi:gpi-anchored elicitin inl11b-like protein [Plasmopara halstedii]|uniref:Elicitin n=1 Tax=Plasmopara halstedii TaxID=4781 RepID=A0A0P1AVS4_PLAHL|nr:gpi-anchored elicitin inl11b-like protein [Plasmopara halstedii]CEG45081.1 gpi-anchored elicitin inl11b-like protein [Plasmopara halstedii]|eukprot:XP_024581450.1 gpi-anchored elicitin inl11b-like protein [Plasmopara halstedii]